MALDLSIYSQFIRTPEQQAEERALLQERQAQAEAARQRVADARRAAQERQATIQAFQQATDPETGIIDYDKATNFVMRVNPGAGQTLMKELDAHKKSAADFEEQHWKAQDAKGKVLGTIAGSITSPDDLEAVRGLVDPEIRQYLPEPNDPNWQARVKQLEKFGYEASNRVTARKDAFDAAMKLGDEARTDAEKLPSLTTALATYASHLDDDNERNAFLTQVAPKMFPAAAVAAVQGKTPQQLRDMQVTEEQKRTGARADAAQQSLQNYRTQELGIRRQEVALSQAREARMEKATEPPQPIEAGTPDYKVAQDLALGRMTPSFFRTLQAYNRDANKKAAVYAKATEINPNFNEADFERGFKFISNPQTQRQLAALDNAMSGIPSLLEASDAAQRSGVTVLNKYTNPVKVALGSQKFANLDVARKAWADEVSGALGFGTATDMKLQLGLDLTDTNLSPANFRSAIQGTVLPFLERKRASILQQGSVYGTPANNSGVPAPAPKVVTMQQLQAIANKNGSTVDQERARAAAAGYTVK